MDPLSELALKHGTDKGPNLGWHNYTPHYHELFGPWRNDVKIVLEIGVYQGASLKMWRDYFPNAQIVGMDYAKEVTENYLRSLNDMEGRTNVFIGNQSDPEDLQSLMNWFPDFDIIVDDGSHNPNDYLVSFWHLWPVTEMFYVIEDIDPQFSEQTLSGVREIVGPEAWIQTIPSQAGAKDRFALVVRK